MRTSLYLALAMLVIADAAGTTQTQCAAIRDPDRRNACLAETNRSPINCFAVRDADSRQMCLARGTGDRARCGAIRDADRRQACFAGMRW